MTARGEPHEHPERPDDRERAEHPQHAGHNLPRGRIIHAAVAVVVIGAVILLLFWLEGVAPAFVSFFRLGRWVALALGVYWLYEALRPRTHGERRGGDRRDHRRRTSDPPLQHCDPPSTEPRAPGEPNRGA